MLKAVNLSVVREVLQDSAEVRAKRVFHGAGSTSQQVGDSGSLLDIFFFSLELPESQMARHYHLVFANTFNG